MPDNPIHPSAASTASDAEARESLVLELADAAGRLPEDQQAAFLSQATAGDETLTLDTAAVPDTAAFTACIAAGFADVLGTGFAGPSADAPTARLVSEN